MVTDVEPARAGQRAAIHRASELTDFVLWEATEGARMFFGKYLPFWLNNLEEKLGFKTEILWKNVGLAVMHHTVGAYWCYYYASAAKWQTVLFAVFMYVWCGLGITTGVHRYWTHRQFKAKQPLRLLLLYLWTCAGQYKIRYWVLAHRMHHKYADTAADSHDITRGKWFAHIGCLLLKPTPEFNRCEKLADMKDIDNDKLVQFHDRYYIVLQVLNCFLLPIAFNMWMWDEDWRCAIAWQMFIRYLAIFHAEMTVNSLAHSYGPKPYDKNAMAGENWFVALLSGGEGWHNFHHSFPYDYKGADYPIRSITTLVIKVFAKIGWAYDLREASSEVIKAYMQRSGTTEDEIDHWVGN